jgi:hypothetical protein
MVASKRFTINADKLLEDCQNWRETAPKLKAVTKCDKLFSKKNFPQHFGNCFLKKQGICNTVKCSFSFLEVEMLQKFARKKETLKFCPPELGRFFFQVFGVMKLAIIHKNI